MSTKTIDEFFSGKSLEIPSYQRDYAWLTSNVDDLFDDIEEALELGSGHYLGTFILCQADKSAPMHVVDGQQRLTTLTMLIDALIGALDDQDLKKLYRNNFIHHPVTGPKFRVLGRNEVFFRELLEKKGPPPDSDGQERMLRAYDWIRQRVMTLKQRGGEELIKQWLASIGQMEVLQFVESSEGKAIRMFQSVNDRGMPLAKMDIVKSLLVYYSNRYLDGQLDTFIAEQFGDAFRSFSRIKRLAAEPGFKIKQVDRRDFVEDEVLRYHYLAFNGDPFDVTVGDYWLTSEGVLNSFLKPTLKALRSDLIRLRSFIETYVSDLTRFFSAFEEVIQSTRSNRQAYLLWVVQELSVTLYPLVIRLHLHDWLYQASTDDPRTLMDIIELTDLRVFKLRGTNPQAEILKITSDLHQHNIDWVVGRLKEFCEWGMPDAMMASRLVDEDVYRNPALVRMLLREEAYIRAQLDQPEHSLQELIELNKNGLTVEHILPQDYENSFNPEGYGFANGDEYYRFVHRLGNLVLLESSINSACRNQAAESKISNLRLYPSSSLAAVRAISAECMDNDNTRFCVQWLLQRSRTLSDLFVSSWPIHPTEPPSD